MNENSESNPVNIIIAEESDCDDDLDYLLDLSIDEHEKLIQI